MQSLCESNADDIESAEFDIVPKPIDRNVDGREMRLVARWPWDLIERNVKEA